MTLTGQELMEREFLVGKSKKIGLTPEEEKRVRELVSKQQKVSSDAPIGEVIAIALLIIGIIALIGLFSGKE